MLELPDETDLAKSLGPRWWFHFGKALCEVIMPEDFYKVGRPGDLHFDDLGLKALARDWAAWPGEASDDVVDRSVLNLFHEIGLRLFGRSSGQALKYSMYFVAQRHRPVPETLPSNRQRHFRFNIGD